MKLPEYSSSLKRGDEFTILVNEWFYGRAKLLKRSPFQIKIKLLDTHLFHPGITATPGKTTWIRKKEIIKEDF